MGRRDVVERRGDAVVGRPSIDGEAPRRDGLVVLGLFEIHLSELEVDLRCPWAVLRQQLAILNAFQPGRLALDGIGNLVFVPVVVGERNAEILDRFGT